MDIESVSSLLHELRKLGSWLDNVESKLWEIFLTQFYRTIPHQEGELDKNLQSNLESGLLFVGVRFRAFNNSVGFLIKWASYLTAVALVIILPIVSYSATPIGGTLGAILSILIFIGGVALLASLGAVLIADILLIFYLASLARYGVTRVRSSLRTKNKTNFKVYSCEITDSENSNNSNISIYKSSFEAFYRMIIYIYFIRPHSLVFIFPSFINY